MVKKLVIDSSKCIGCSICKLTCSIAHNHSFDLNNCHIQITKDESEGLFNVFLLPTCIKCFKCSKSCPTECLSIVEADITKESEG